MLLNTATKMSSFSKKPQCSATRFLFTHLLWSIRDDSQCSTVAGTTGSYLSVVPLGVELFELARTTFTNFSVV